MLTADFLLNPDSDYEIWWCGSYAIACEQFAERGWGKHPMHTYGKTFFMVQLLWKLKVCK